jgi:hypothetical protein
MHREIVPAELIVPAIPVLDDDWVARRLRGVPGRYDAAQSIDMRGIRTSPASVDGAERLSRVVLRDLERAVQCGDRTSIWKALRERPELILVGNIRDTLSRWISNGSLRAPRGRPRGATTWSPPVVAGLVDHLISSRAARSREHAFSRLAVVGLSYDSAKRLYVQAFREQRFRPLLLLDEDNARPIEDGDLRWMAGAESLLPGNPIVRSTYDRALGSAVNINFTAAG